MLCNRVCPNKESGHLQLETCGGGSGEVPLSPPSCRRMNLPPGGQCNARRTPAPNWSLATLLVEGIPMLLFLGSAGISFTRNERQRLQRSAATELASRFLDS